MLCGLSGGDCMADDRDKVSNQHPLSAVTQYDYKLLLPAMPAYLLAKIRPGS